MTQATHRLALIGFGTVGQAFANVVQLKQAEMKKRYHCALQIVAVSSLSKGSLYHPDGLDITALLDTVKTSGTFDSYPDENGLRRGWDNLKIIRHSNADTIVEVSYTDMATGQPALDHCRTALAHGKHVVTSNKGPAALACGELLALAQANGAHFYFESTVMAGTPSLRMPQIALAGNEISAVRGILNGTTNYILTQMEAGTSYIDALQQAQQLGYAEADPTADVEGIDALAKVLILAQTVMNCELNKNDISCRGISHLTLKDIETARDQGKRWKLIGEVSKQGGQVAARVHPEMLPLSDPLAQVMGTTNAITYHTDLLGAVTLVGPGAGGTETAAGILTDVINLACFP